MTFSVNIKMSLERGDQMITVDVEGTFDEYGSYNPQERGFHLEGIYVENDILLTASECDHAEELLYREARL